MTVNKEGHDYGNITVEPASSLQSSNEEGKTGYTDVVELVAADPVKQRSWRSYLWDSLDKSPEERRLLFKLDCAVLSFASLGYLIKYLDQANISNAFVSGMETDLGLYGNQLTYMGSFWTAGYVIGQIPSNIILTRVRPSIWIPALEVIWTILTFSIAGCNSAKQIYVVRFFVGLAESAFYPGMQYLVGSWYRKDELAKRSCIFHTSSAIATMFSGYLMAAVYNLNGVGGLAGWKWLFIMDGIISLPIATAGFFMLPDLPETTRAWYLNKEERALAVQRMAAEGRKPAAPYTRQKVRKILSSWHIYALTLLYILFNNGNSGAVSAFAMYLKDHKNPTYEVWQIDVYPTTTYAVQIVSTLVFAWSSDTFLKGRRWPPIVFGACINIIVYASLTVWDIPTGWRWACYMLTGAGFGLSGLCMAWAHEICSGDREERAITIASMNEMAYVVQAWLPLIVWQQVDAPRYHKGFPTALALSVCLIATAFGVRYLHQREVARKVADSEEELVDGSIEREE